jgi:2-oxoglutarate ferredoxin oxidoreductase subunit delta
MSTQATPKKTGGKTRGFVKIRVDECKGCGCCIADCPQQVLEFSPTLNRFGYRPAAYKGEGCIACGICFYACPEPGAITVYKLEEGE